MSKNKKKTEKTKLTELVFILDRSGSMAGLESDTIGGYNSLLKKQKKEPGEAIVSTVLFDHLTEVIHDRTPIRSVAPLTEREYFTRGTTALYDAVGGAIHHIGNIHKYARPEDRPWKTLFIITTDGLENASQRYAGARVREMIERQTEKYGWEFLFLGANMDAAQAAGDIGIAAERAIDYAADSGGTALNFAVLSGTVSSLRSAGSVPEDWAAPIAADMERRGRDRK